MSDEELIILCALRYALGRKTYITGVVSDYILKKLKKKKKPSNGFRENVIKDIEDANSTYEGKIGMDCDHESWMKLLNAVKRIKK